MLFPNFENLLSYKEDDNQENQSSNYNYLDDSFSLIFSKESQLKNPVEFSDIQAINNSNNKNIEGDKECSPAPAPLRSSPNQNQNQNELSNSHNLECPEVVNKPINSEQLDEKTVEMLKIFTCEFNNNEEDLVEKPFDENIYFLENENMTRPINNLENCELENKSAAINVVPINENQNSFQNKLRNLNLSNSNFTSNIQELSCPNNNFVSTPTDNNSRQKIKNFLFIKTKEGKKKTINQKGFVRKLKPDSIRKKIKSRFHKKIRQIINNKLKEAGSKFLFDLFPQAFITNINIEFNRPLLNITMRELFQKSFGYKAKDREKINYNAKVIQYLENNPNIINNGFISEYLNSTYEEIIKKYMGGNYLLEDIKRLEKEGEDSDYISRYTFIAKKWIDFYKNGFI